MKTETEEVKKCPVPLWKRMGYIGFWFFMIKGILWLVLLAVGLIWGPEIVTEIKGFFGNIL
ncbi:MAG: hypothetical protein ACPGVH_00875 [Chitinophagales bacterium]